MNNVVIETQISEPFMVSFHICIYKATLTLMFYWSFTYDRGTINIITIIIMMIIMCYVLPRIMMTY